MNNNGYYGDFESLAEEQAEYEKWLSNQEPQEPDVVPCKCGNQMYEIEEMCDECKLNQLKGSDELNSKV